MLNMKTGRFALKVEGPRYGGGNVLANKLDTLSLVNFYNQPEVEYVGRRMGFEASLLEEDGIMRERTPFMDFVQESGRTETVTKSKIRFKQRGKRQVHFRLASTVTNPTPGLADAPFTIELNTNAFRPSDRLAPLEAPDQQVTIQQKAKSIGGKWKYTVRYHGRNPGLHFPTQYLTKGTKWYRAGSASVGEGSTQWGATLFEKGTSLIVFEVGLWKTGMRLKLTDDVLNGNWMTATEVQLDQEGNVILDERDQPKPLEDGVVMANTIGELNMQREARVLQERDLFWGVSSMGRILDTSSDTYRQTGAGVIDWLADGHTFYYTPHEYYTSMSEFTDPLEKVMEDNSPADSRYIIQCGRPLLKLADKLIRREFGKDAAVQRDVDNFLERMGFVIPGGVAAFKMKNPMFNAYEIKTHGLMQFQWTPNLDAKWRGGPRHPRTGEIIMGYWGLLFDIGMGNGARSNVRYVRKANSRIFGYDTGAVGQLMGQGSAGTYMGLTSGERAATLYHGESYGLYMENINKAIRYLPNIK